MNEEKTESLADIVVGLMKRIEALEEEVRRLGGSAHISEIAMQTEQHLAAKMRLQAAIHR